MDEQIREAAEYVLTNTGRRLDDEGWPAGTDEKFVEYAKVLANHLLPQQECMVKYLPGEGPETV